MDIIYHYPPELFKLLTDTIPLLCRSKRDVMLFFEGAGVQNQLTSDLWHKVENDRDSITKFEIVSIILQRLNEKGDTSLRERRIILKRVTEFEDYSTCWPNDQLKAKGLVAEIQRVVKVKDTFTRINIEREKERHKHIAERDLKIEQLKKQNENLDKIKMEFCKLFSIKNPQERGKRFEKVLNSLFDNNKILIREAFARNEEGCIGTVEQIDGVVDLNGEIYLVEIKWKEDAVDINDVSRHLVRLYHRGCTRGIFISASGYTSAAISTCKEALQKTVIILSTLEELVQLLEQKGDLKNFFKAKIESAIIDKNPFKIV